MSGDNSVSYLSVCLDFILCRSLQNFSCDEGTGCLYNGHSFLSICLCCEISCLSDIQKLLCKSCIKK